MSQDKQVKSIVRGMLGNKPSNEVHILYVCHDR